MIRSDEGLTLETSLCYVFTVEIWLLSIMFDATIEKVAFSALAMRRYINNID